MHKLENIPSSRQCKS